MNGANALDLLKTYRQLQPRLPAIVDETSIKLERVLSEVELNIHSISHRVKSEESLRRKIARPDRTYSTLDDVTDIIGFRVVTYFEDSIEKIGQLIEKNFSVDFKNSTNKLRALDQERFGYRSMHYVCIDQGAEKFRFEIQIRTVLQHAWAEIEHDLGYKSPDGIPGVIRRRFSQVASILEIADREFVSIRRDVSEYQSSLAKVGVDRDQNIPLDLVSLEALLSHETAMGLDRELAEVLKIATDAQPFFPAYLLRALSAVEIKTVADAFGAIEKHRGMMTTFVPLYFSFAEKALRLSRASVENVNRGYSLLFIAHLAMLERDGLSIDKANRAARFYQALDYPENPKEAASVSRVFIETLQSAGFFGEA